MIYLKNISKIKEKTGYPFIPLICTFSQLKFTKPVTIFSGENGSGKSTLLKIIATQMGCVFNDKENLLEPLDEYFRISKIKPSTSLHFSAESFIKYINNFDKTMAETLAEIEEIKKRTDISEEGKSFALMPYYRTLNEMQNQYSGTLSEQSHGEGFTDFFLSRLKKGGFYLIDEPEAALSFYNQYALAYRINLFATLHECQFVICTHSPIMCAIPDAEIFEIKNDQLLKSSYEELENLQFLSRFLKNKENMFK